MKKKKWLKVIGQSFSPSYLRRTNQVFFFFFCCQSDQVPEPSSAYIKRDAHSHPGASRIAVHCFSLTFPVSGLIMLRRVQPTRLSTFRIYGHFLCIVGLIQTCVVGCFLQKTMLQFVLFQCFLEELICSAGIRGNRFTHPPPQFVQLG